MRLYKGAGALLLTGAFCFSSGCSKSDTKPKVDTFSPSAIMNNPDLRDVGDVKIYEYVPQNAPDKLIIIAQDNESLDIEVIDLNKPSSDSESEPQLQSLAPR